MARLNLHYYLTPEEVAEWGFEEPGARLDADLTDPKILIQPTFFVDEDGNRVDPPAGWTPLSPAERALPTPSAPDPATPPPPSPSPLPPPIKVHGWTPENQRAFLRAVAEGYTVEAACGFVGLSVQSAYQFRRRAAGAAFALGWNAALLLARDRIADTLVSRVHDGQVDTFTRADGSEVTRHRYDNRLALATLTRLDRLADKQADEGTHQAARLVAQDFEPYLDMLAADGGPARAGLFLARRATIEVSDVHEDSAAAIAAVWASPALAPIAALANADRYVRAGAALPAEVDTADLDYAKRDGWTADQWRRADAAGLLTKHCGQSGESEVYEGEDDSFHNPKFPKARPPHSHGTGLVDRIWFDPDEGEFLTNFPPPEDFDGYENFRWGHPDYERALTVEEETTLEERQSEQIQENSAEDADLRDQWFDAVSIGTADVMALFDARDADDGVVQSAAALPDADVEEDDDEYGSAEDEAFLEAMEEKDELTRHAQNIRRAYAALDAGDASVALDTIRDFRAFRARLAGEDAGSDAEAAADAAPVPASPPPRPANRKARRAAAARQRSQTKSML